MQGELGARAGEDEMDSSSVGTDTGNCNLLAAGFGEEADVFDTSGADILQGNFHVAIRGSGIGGDVDAVFRARAKSLVDVILQFIRRNPVATEKYRSVASYGDKDGVFANRSGQPGEMFGPGFVDGHRHMGGEQEVRIEDEGQHEENTCESGGVDVAKILRATLADSFVAASGGRPEVEAMIAGDGLDGQSGAREEGKRFTGRLERH
jgi:hypothetical protein